MYEPQRYLSNARDTLKKAGRENGYYTDSKYVSSACGIAYKGVLLALEDYLSKRNRTINKKKHQRKNVDDYLKNLTLLNKKLLTHFDAVYHILHLDGYYDAVVNRETIDLGFKLAKDIIEGIEQNKF